MELVNINPEFNNFSKILQWLIFNNVDQAANETAIFENEENNSKDHGLIIGIDGKFKLFLWLLIRDNGYEQSKEFVGRTDIIGELNEVFQDPLGRAHFSQDAINSMLSVIKSLL